MLETFMKIIKAVFGKRDSVVVPPVVTDASVTDEVLAKPVPEPVFEQIPAVKPKKVDPDERNPFESQG